MATEADFEALCRFHRLVRCLEQGECERCGGTVIVEADAIRLVEQTVEGRDDIGRVTVDELRISFVCDDCARLLSGGPSSWTWPADAEGARRLRDQKLTG